MNGGVELTEKIVPNNKFNYLVILIVGNRTREHFGTGLPTTTLVYHFCQIPVASLYAPPLPPPPPTFLKHLPFCLHSGPFISTVLVGGLPGGICYFFFTMKNFTFFSSESSKIAAYLADFMKNTRNILISRLYIDYISDCYHYFTKFCTTEYFLSP